MDQLNISGPCDVSQSRENMLNNSGHQYFENRNNVSDDAISNNSDQIVA